MKGTLFFLSNQVSISFDSIFLKKIHASLLNDLDLFCSFTKIKQKYCFWLPSQGASFLKNKNKNLCCIVYIHKKYKNKPKAKSLLLFFVLCFSLDFGFPYQVFLWVFDHIIYKLFWKLSHYMFFLYQLFSEDIINKVS